MAEKTLIAKIREDETEAGTLIVASPVVGMADGAPADGVFLNSFDRVITMKVLNERFVLRLPRDVHGRVSEVFIPNAYTPVVYNEAIARIDPRALAEGEGAAGSVAGSAGATAEDEDAGLITVPAPSEGIFYRRSSPDAPPYVELGSSVSPGTVLGLVEVMKCFNQIAYGGPGFPDKVIVAKILVDDAKEVQFEEPLFWVRPLD